MSHGSRQTSLDNLAHIANMSHELQMLNQQLEEEPPGMATTNSLPGQDGGNSEKRTGEGGNGGDGGDSGDGAGNGTGVIRGSRGKRIACVECRQQKSRCDAHERRPAACSRCSKKGLRCDLKVEYKRTYKRARIAQIEKEFAELKKNLTAGQASELLSKVPAFGKQNFLKVAGFAEDEAIGDANGDSIDEGGDVVQHSAEGATQSKGSTPWSTAATPTDQTFNFKNTHQTPESASSSGIDSKATNSGAKKPSKISLDIPQDALVCEEKTLDEVTLSKDMIKSLFFEYIECYHPILPVVDIYKGPEKIHRLCPALFWVMMFVSLRRFYDDSLKTRLLKLSPIVKSILAEISISPITRYNPTVEDEPILNACSVYSVQAFLLYTYWPPITSSLSADTSWNTIGVALFQAIRIGLHSTGLLLPEASSNDPNQVAMAQENAKTWIFCNIASQKIATAFGFPGFVQFDTSIWSSCRPNSLIKIPTFIQSMMEIAHFEDQVSKAFSSNPVDPHGLIDPTESLPLLKVLSRQLDELELKLTETNNDDDGLTEFQLWTARVHLLTYYFMDSARISFFELQKGLVRLYNSAISLINHAEMCQARNKNFVRYLPGVYILNIWQASCIIGKLAHSPLKNYIDIGSGKQSYQAAITLTAKASILKHDIAHRSSGIMRSVWQLFTTLDKENNTNLIINIKSRMSASVFFDCLYLLRERVGMIRLNSRNDSQEESSESNANAANDEMGSDDDEEYGFQDNEAVISEDDDDDKRKDDNSQMGTGSQKSTPGSNASSRTKRQRSLSNNANAESKARKIIRTIPLDPQPISVGERRSSIFKLVNNNSNDSDHPSNEMNGKIGPHQQPPANRQTSTNSSSNKHSRAPHAAPLVPMAKQQAPQIANTNPTVSAKYPERNPNPTNATNPPISYTSVHQGMPLKNGLDVPLPNSIFNDSPLQGNIESLEMNPLDLSSDLLWKDVDSVMNDFGFHTQ